MEKYCVTRKNNYVHGLAFDKELGKDGFGRFLYDKFIQNGERVFQIDASTGKSETYGSVLKRSIRVALEMKSRGITENDIVVLCAGNTMNAFIPIAATQLLNATVASLDPSQSVRDVVYLLNLVAPKMIFVQDSALHLIQAARKEFLFTPKLVIMGNHVGEDSFDDFLQPHPFEENFIPKRIDGRKKTAMIFFSSGTTGMPKGICITAGGILTSILATAELDLTDTIGFHATSFYWITGMIITISVILNDGRKIILPNFELEAFFKAVQDYKINFTLLSTSIAYEFNKENVSKYDLSCLKIISIAGSTISCDHMQRCREMLPRATIISGYGLTEASGYVFAFPRGAYREAQKYPTSCGIPQPGVIVKVVDPETEEILGPNQQGEIRFSSKYRFIGYFKKDSRNAFDSEGFIKTGDIGYYDKNNYFYICDRIKDMFKYKSWHIVPASVERVILQHPAVKEAVVVGVPHPIDGDHPMAVVVLKDEFMNTDGNDLINFINERVLDREKLRGGLKVIDKFPKTPSGKISRAAVRKAAIEVGERNDDGAAAVVTGLKDSRKSLEK